MFHCELFVGQYAGVRVLYKHPGVTDWAPAPGSVMQRKNKQCCFRQKHVYRNMSPKLATGCHDRGKLWSVPCLQSTVGALKGFLHSPLGVMASSVSIEAFIYMYHYNEHVCLHILSSSNIQSTWKYTRYCLVLGI